MLGILSGFYVSEERSQLIQDKHVVCRNRSLHIGLQSRDKGTPLPQIGWEEWCHWMRKQRAFQEARVGRKRGRGTASDSKGTHVWESGKSSSGSLMETYEQCRGIEYETVGWHHRLNGHEFEQTSEDSEGQGSLACCSPWGLKESDTTEWLNNNNKSENFLIRGQQPALHCLWDRSSLLLSCWVLGSRHEQQYEWGSFWSSYLLEGNMWVHRICEAIRKSLSNW